VALFGPNLQLLVAVSDGRQLTFPVPERYREDGIEIEPQEASSKEPVHGRERVCPKG